MKGKKADSTCISYQNEVAAKNSMADSKQYNK